MKNNNKKLFEKRIMSFSEVFIMIISTFAFAFVMGGMTIGITIPSVTAATAPATGCCLEAEDGSICQNMNQFDKDNCKSGLVATECNLVQKCQVGCCYNTNEGTCSLNSPKGKCESDGGNWSNSATCNIQQCSLGCCIVADQALTTTSRECTKISQELNFEKNFQALDGDGTCSSKTNLDAKGACLTPTGDFSGENDCKFTTKSNCKSGDFKEGFLCTAKEFKTNCFPAKNTTCVEGKDQIYYTDTCGNIANVYDSSKFDDVNYWTAVISPTESCSTASASCGNCDYTQGSVCKEYTLGKDTKPTFGSNVCRDLNCANGRKHGESWCINDYPGMEVSSVASVGSRWFKASCINGEISVEPCADFNQQVCIENSASSGFTDAACVANGWKSCINANDKSSYSEVKKECDQLPQCAMFNDMYGEDKLTRSDGAIFAGFVTNITNEEQGAAGELGKGSNIVLPFCIPKFTPGFQFWTSTKEEAKYGGSTEETSAICSLGSFTCVSKKTRTCELVSKDILNPSNWIKQFLCIETGGASALLKAGDASCDDWQDVENWECNIDGVQETISKEDLPKLMSALNERCRALGSCGTSVNIGGGVNVGSGFSVERVKINAQGDNEKVNSTDYVLPEDYIGELKSSKITPIKSAKDIPFSSSSLTDAGDSGDELKGLGNNTLTLNDLLSSADIGQEQLDKFVSTGSIVSGILGLVGFMFIGTAYKSAVASASATNVGQAADVAGELGTTPSTLVSNLKFGIYNLVAAIIGSTIGFQIGNVIAKNQNWSPGLKQQFIEGMAAFGAATAVGIATGIYVISVGCTNPVTCLPALVIAAATSIYTNCIDNNFDENEYYVMQFKCEAWKPPKDGDCSLCNGDVRTCSEYRCKSLGTNCKYFNSNGEPGYCAAYNDIWSATITPWQEALSEGNKYSDVTTNHFSITGNGKDNTVAAWTGLQFGITTDKPAQCKIDTKHTNSIDEMSTDFVIDTTTCATGSCSNQGTNHKIALSQNIGANNSGTSTLGLVEGENNYYIRCKNYAGQSNTAEFAVKIIVDSGPDYSPPIITSFTPSSGKYLKVGESSSSMLVYVNEPSECRYSQNVNNRFEDMKGKLTCSTNPSSAFLGNWPCYAVLGNLTAGENKFYFQCEDQPGLLNNSAERRNINRNSKEYSINVCSTGLSITSISPKETIVTGKSPVNVDLTAETSGCIDGGKATCSFKGFGNIDYIPFFSTDAKSHSQTFTDLPAGDNNVLIECEDDAGNTANDSIRINVELDNSAPKVLRNYVLESKVSIITNEISECKYTTNSSIGCSFSYDDKDLSLMETSKSSALLHGAKWEINKDYYIKCKDTYGNENIDDCAIRLRTY